MPILILPRPEGFWRRKDFWQLIYCLLYTSNYSLTCPLGEKRIAFYAKEDCRLAYGGLGGRVIADAQDCFEDGGKPGRAWIEEGTLYAQVKASIPCLVELAHSWNPKDGEPVSYTHLYSGHNALRN